ncbi:MAG: hypothetical protein JSS81_13455 [Acidobacteria bacterium]|nr:hypothetical protein [Acidobacteriota bacterium]
MTNKGFLGTGVLILLASAAFGQINIDDQQAIERRRQERDLESNRGTFKTVKKPSEEDARREFDNERRRRRSAAARDAMREAEKNLAAQRAPAPADAVLYKEFLKDSKTGLIRLFPDLGCESKNLIRVDGDCAGAVLSSWGYSFRRRDYVVEDFWDLRLKDGELIADGFMSQELLTELGDVPLENLSVESPGVAFLAEYSPSGSFTDARRQYEEIARGVEAGGFRYSKSVKVAAGMTYALRFTAFRNDDSTLIRIFYKGVTDVEKSICAIDEDRRFDAIVVFRVIRREDDGGLSILWKELTRRRAPKVIFERSEKLADIRP